MQVATVEGVSNQLKWTKECSNIIHLGKCSEVQLVEIDSTYLKYSLND